MKMGVDEIVRTTLPFKNTSFTPSPQRCAKWFHLMAVFPACPNPFGHRIPSKIHHLPHLLNDVQNYTPFNLVIIDSLNYLVNRILNGNNLSFNTLNTL